MCGGRTNRSPPRRSSEDTPIDLQNLYSLTLARVIGDRFTHRHSRHGISLNPWLQVRAWEISATGRIEGAGFNKIQSIVSKGTVTASLLPIVCIPTASADPSWKPGSSIACATTRLPSDTAAVMRSKEPRASFHWNNMRKNLAKGGIKAQHLQNLGLTRSNETISSWIFGFSASP